MLFALVCGLLASVAPHCCTVEVHSQSVELQPDGGVVPLAAPDAARQLVRSELTVAPTRDTSPAGPRNALEAKHVSLHLAAAVKSNGMTELGAAFGHVKAPVLREPAALGLPHSANSSMLQSGAEIGAEEEFLPMLGINSAADIAYKAMDMLYGTTGIIDDDYPFACLCDEEGKCEGDDMATPCSGRPGSGSLARPRSRMGLFSMFPWLMVMDGVAWI
mmetsp:Transcript_44964/g.88996  ORF Transcript_44964/g.88996 Transcript_44964/m.88996 type:complete len:218 (-) Transcript_44964:100-753(-)